MKSENFILCHVHAYEYFGGVTRLLVPDNLKTGVTKNTRYETVIPKAYQEMADYYDIAIVPARPKAPDDKPNAEGSGRFATTWILASIRDYHFFSFEEARDTVEAYFRGGRVASHVRLKKAQRDAVMMPGHMPEAHRRYVTAK